MYVWRLFNWVFLNILTGFGEFSDKTYNKEDYFDLQTLVAETGMPPQCQQETGNRQDL